MSAPFTKTNIVLAAACVAQIVALLVVGSLSETPLARSKEDAAIAGKKPFATFTADDVFAIECKKREADGMRLEKELKKVGDKDAVSWVIADRDRAPARTANVDELVSTLRKITLSNIVTRQPKRYAGLNVADDAADLRLVAYGKDGKKLADVYLGETKNYTSLNVRFAGDDAVYASSGAGYQDFAAEVQSVAETEFLKLDAAKIVGVKVKHEGTEFEAVKVVPASRPTAPESGPTSRPESGPTPPPPAPYWTTKGASPETLDVTKMETWLKGVAQLSLSEPVGRERKPEYGLDRPSATLVLTTDDGKETVIAIGAERKDKYDWYATATGVERVVTVKSYNVTDWFKKAIKDLQPTVGGHSGAGEGG